VPTTVAVNLVMTNDTTPAAPPYKVSRAPAKDDVLFRVIPTHDGELVPTDDLIPAEGTRYPDEGLWPDDDLYPDHGATVVEGEPRDIIGISARLGGNAISPTSGRPVVQRTNRCSPVRRCGVSREGFDTRCSARGFRVASGALIEETFQFVTFDDGGGDGTRDVAVWVLTESQGWS
jgi:hypothetical protein